ncbi:MAG: M20/M25/M40 family metallo-hydrolase [Verrucomicrobiota bacterium]
MLKPVMRLRKIFFSPLLVALLCLSSSSPAAEDSLAHFVRDPRPWLHLPANSEQRQPVYLGATPRELSLNISPSDGGIPVLVDSLRADGELQARDLRRALIEQKKIRPSGAVEFEAWPVRGDLGEPNWAYARWRPKGETRWQWLDASKLPQPSSRTKAAPFLPVLLDPAKKTDFAMIFDDALKLKELYDKPLFSECIWTDPAHDGAVIEAWLPLKDREGYGKKLAGRLGRGENAPACRVLPQPARLNGRPATFILTADSSGVKWPDEIRWKPAHTELPLTAGAASRISDWPADFKAAYRKDILALDGEQDAVLPLSGRKVRFRRKNSVDPRNQLVDVVRFLEERYRQLGIKTRRQEFTWRGIPQANLIAIIPGTGRDASRRPVLMADHIDTAFCEDIYDKNGQRVPAPGADDNFSATGVLLRAAEVLKDKKFPHDIWLVHLTGEEFPADDLGARHLVGGMLRDRQDIEGLVLMDMIGHRESADDRIFQVNPGDDEASLRMAKTAIDSAAGLTRFEPKLRTRFDPRSYLYNTDGLIFSDAGYPVVYLNEHINRLENFWRKGYHHTTDNSKKMDWDYASDIGKVAIQTAAALAAKPGR